MVNVILVAVRNPTILLMNKYNGISLINYTQLPNNIIIFLIKISYIINLSGQNSIEIRQIM